jgi:hypothetical protein
MGLKRAYFLGRVSRMPYRPVRDGKLCSLFFRRFSTTPEDWLKKISVTRPPDSSLGSLTSTVHIKSPPMDNETKEMYIHGKEKRNTCQIMNSKNKGTTYSRTTYQENFDILLL